MSTNYWTNRSSDRANLLSGSSNNSDSTPSGRKIKHDPSISSSQVFEQQNDSRLQELSSKLTTLHKITIDIHDDVKDQVNLLDDTGDSFTSVKGGLGGTVGKLKHMTSVRHKQYMCYLILCIVGIVFLIYNFWGFWSKEEIEMTDMVRNDV
ncbi:6040_t:CDS:2 [Funneliformis geosporum]|uniref:16788_t:CDS:1 n=1 Tax=Funneliformis geosporum TaxID=1117311 RepID=A0A9W4SB98_9GLOM|nr:16788_t:CDS:2 [Funneliformis geosporum]CAI2178652.1 6040_t:CDS:2 [Funneliformis geosporum]